MDIINETTVEKTKTAIKKANPPIVIKARNDTYNRKILEYGKFDVLLDVEAGYRRNKLRQIDSGFNHVLGKIATKKNVALGIDFTALQKLSKTHKAARLSKIKQNVDICKKTKTNFALINAQDNKSAQAFLRSLGAATNQVKQAHSFQ